MRLRFSGMDAGYLDDLVRAEHEGKRNNEPLPDFVEIVDGRVAAGFCDFLLYAFLVYAVASANQSFFFLWILTIPFVFLATVMPIGPLSSWCWNRSRNTGAKRVTSDVDVLQALIARRQRLLELAYESATVEAELIQDLPTAGDLKYAFETQIRQAQETRGRIRRELTRLEGQIAEAEIEKIRIDQHLRVL